MMRVLLIVSALLVGCTSTPAPKKSVSSEKSDLVELDKISQVARAFKHVSAGDARDCRQYAVFVGLRGNGLLDLSKSLSGGEVGKEVGKVWGRVFKDKSELEQKEAIDNASLRVEARQNGTREKLSGEKCISPVLEKLDETKLNYGASNL